MELADGREPLLRQPDILGNLTPAALDCQPSVASLLEADVWVNQHALTPFFSEVREERVTELDRIAEHIELSLTEVLQRIDLEIGRADEETETHVTGAEGRLAQRPKPATTGCRPVVPPATRTHSSVGAHYSNR